MKDPNASPVYYLASPYSSKVGGLRDRRYHAVNKVAVALIKDGFVVIEPIVTGHVKQGVLGTDFKTWETVDKALINVCRAMFVLKLPGWKDSVGVTAEIHYARDTLKKTIFYLDPADYLTKEEISELQCTPTEKPLSAA